MLRTGTWICPGCVPLWVFRVVSLRRFVRPACIARVCSGIRNRRIIRIICRRAAGFFSGWISRRVCRLVRIRIGICHRNVRIRRNAGFPVAADAADIVSGRRIHIEHRAPVTIIAPFLMFICQSARKQDGQQKDGRQADQKRPAFFHGTYLRISALCRSVFRGFL